MSNLLKNLLIALGLAVLLFVGYVVFMKGDSGSTSLLSDSASPQADLDTQELLAKINELNTYNVDGEVFSSALFESLRDFRIDLGTEPEGRDNPFAPI
jgi:hypothetical protein